MNPAPLRYFELPPRPKLRFAGPQALWFLNQLVSNQVEGLQPGEGAEALVLTPKGRITAVLRVLATPQGVLVDADGADRTELHDFFAMRVFATRVTIADITDDYTIVRVAGSDAGTRVSEALRVPGPPPSEPHASLGVGSALLVALAPPLDGVDLWIGRAGRAEVLAALQDRGIVAMEPADYQAVRVAAGVPEFVADLAEGYLPQQAALERAVHFSKGCYLGQEAVAMAQRGRIRRRLRHLEFAGDPVVGDVYFEGEACGAVTSISPAGFGIGMVSTSVPVGGRVTVSASEALATVRELPATVYGPRVPSARELRERLQGG